jgi:hypothetical protein
MVVMVWAAANWIVQVVRKPSEVFVAVSGSLARVPAQTWRQYGPLFDEHSTAVITPELLAALAQVESSGNPVARTYWRWRFSWNPFEVYGPASSAVGMFQITDGTFAEARRYCIHDHVVVEGGPWHGAHSCRFNALYTRVVPAHAVEMTAALLDRAVARVLARNRITTATPHRRQNLAAVIHLCGEGAGDGYVRRGFRFSGGQRCGDNSALPPRDKCTGHPGPSWLRMLAPVMPETIAFGHDDLEVVIVGRSVRALDKTDRPGRVFRHDASGLPGEARVRFIAPVQNETLPFQHEDFEVLVEVLNERCRTSRPVGDGGARRDRARNVERDDGPPAAEVVGLAGEERPVPAAAVQRLVEQGVVVARHQRNHGGRRCRGSASAKPRWPPRLARGRSRAKRPPRRSD